jgi:hypothetical protein
MAITDEQMRDCILDALSQHVITFDRPSEMTVSWAEMRRRTQDAAIVRGLLDGARTAFDPEENRRFEGALWILFQDGTLAPTFRAQRYGKKGWEEGEFKLTARGMRGFGSAPPPTRDVESFLASLRPACLGMARCETITAYGDQAVRAAKADLHLAAAVMTALALEAALLELRDAYVGGHPLRDGASAPRVGLAAIAGWLAATLEADPEVQGAIADAPELQEGFGPVRAGAGAIASACHAEGTAPPTPTGPEVDAGLMTLIRCVERTNALVRLLRVPAGS